MQNSKHCVWNCKHIQRNCLEDALGWNCLEVKNVVIFYNFNVFHAKLILHTLFTQWRCQNIERPLGKQVKIYSMTMAFTRDDSK